MHQIQLKSSSDQTDHHMKFRPSSNQFMPTSCQLRIIQHARTISQVSLTPQSYHPAMGRRQRRQPINPPRHRRMGVLNPGSTSLRRVSAKLNGRAAALAGALGFYSTFCLCARWCGGDSPQASSIKKLNILKLNFLKRSQSPR